MTSETPSDTQRIESSKAYAPGGIRALLLSLGIGLATTLLMLATEPHMAMVWDEGFTLVRETRVRQWLRAIRDPMGFASQWRPDARDIDPLPGIRKSRAPCASQLDSRSKLLLDPQVLAWFWPFAREEPHGHPPFYALLGLAGDAIAPAWTELCACPTGADPAVQLHRRGHLGLCEEAMGDVARRLGRRSLGFPTEPLRPRPLRGLRRTLGLALGPGGHCIHARRGTSTAYRRGAGGDGGRRRLSASPLAARRRPSFQAGSCQFP